MPLTRMQREYLANCTHRYNVKCGATGSGKSYVDIAVTIPQRLLAMRGEGLAVMIGNTRSTLERNILEPMRSLYSEDVVSQIGRDNTAQIFGRKVYCLGADKKTSVSKIQGATFEWVYGDEVATWSEDVFQMLKSRLRCEHSRFDGTCNPDSPNHWFKRFLDGDSDIYRQDYTIWDGALAPDVIEALIKDYGSGVYYDRYILGKWTLAEGLVYPEWEGALESRYTGSAAKYAVSCDYGTQNAFAALLWAFDGGRVPLLRTRHGAPEDGRRLCGRHGRLRARAGQGAQVHHRPERHELHRRDAAGRVQDQKWAQRRRGRHTRDGCVPGQRHGAYLRRLHGADRRARRLLLGRQGGRRQARQGRGP